MMALEIIKIACGMFLFILPSFLFSFFLSKEIKFLERVIFGFGFSTVIFVLFLFIMGIIAKATYNLFLFFYLLFLLFSLLASYKKIKFSLPKIDKVSLFKSAILFLILAFVFYMTFLPHITYNYYLPFHGDEWIHWGLARGFIENGKIEFINPFTGEGKITNLEIGFHIFISSFKWLSGANFQSIFVIMPSLIAIFSSLTAFCLLRKENELLGYISAFLIAFVPTTIRFLGPSFFVPVALGLFFALFCLWIVTLNGNSRFILIFLILIFLVISHPPSYGAIAIIISLFAFVGLFEKKYKEMVLIPVAFIPLAFVYFLPHKNFQGYLEMGINALFGEKYESTLPSIKISISYLGGYLSLALIVIGSFFAIVMGRRLLRTIFLSSISFMTIIFLYDKYGYGVQVVRDRVLLFLYLVLLLIISYGIVSVVSYSKYLLKYIRLPLSNKMFSVLLTVILSFLILFYAYPSHKEERYYKLVSAKEFESYEWLRLHIDEYRDENHSFDRAAVFPQVAGVFSAVTGIYTISSNIWPVYGKQIADEMYDFIINKCNNTDFLEKYGLSVVYAPYGVENEYLNEVHNNTYLYYGVPPVANFSYKKIDGKIRFVSNSTTKYGRIVKWLWDFGDGNESKGIIEGLLLRNGDYIKTNLLLNQSFTIEMWIKPYFSYNDGVLHRIFFWRSKEAYVTCFKHSNNRLYFVVKVNKWRAVYSTIEFNENEWHHLACVYNGRTGEFFLYWDGKINGVRKGGESFNATEGTFWVGYPKNGFDGIVKDVRIYNRALTGIEIEDNFIGNITTKGVVLWWKLDKAGDTVIDNIDGYNGTLYGGKWINYAEYEYIPGEYEVSLTVWNDDGLSDTVKKKIVMK